MLFWFNSSVDLASRRKTQADLAAECGFFDQAHLAREVRDLSGQTPTELRASLVNFFQDEASLSS